MSDRETVDDPIEEYENNLFIAQLPPILSLRDMQLQFDRPPLLSERDRLRSPEQRLHIVHRLLNYSQPTVVARDLGQRIEHMIYRGYVGRNPETSEWARMVQAIGMRERAVKDAAKAGRAEKTGAASKARVVDGSGFIGDLKPTEDTSMSTLVVGPPGMGKTHSVRTALCRFKQVVFHRTPFDLAQILWLRVECPATGSLVALCHGFFAAVDEALRKAGFESNLEQEYKRQSIGVMIIGMARVANLHAIGLLVIDEIQHVKVAHGAGSELLNFLVTLRNSIGVPLMMVGTMSALGVVQRTFRDARRADGLGSILFNRMAPADEEQRRVDVQAEQERTARLEAAGDDVDPADALPIVVRNYGPDFAGFVRRMWRFQYTGARSEISVEVLNALYDETQGITDLVVKCFVLAQVLLINQTAAAGGKHDAADEIITAELIRQVAKTCFNAVRPFVKALRENDQAALRKWEDLSDFNQWFADYIVGIGMRDVEPLEDADHGAAQLPPIVADGRIDPESLDAVLEGLGVPLSDRAAMIARHADQVEAGDLAGLVGSVSRELAAVRSRDGKARTKRQAPIDGDLRGAIEGASDAAEVARRIGAPSLEAIGAG